MNKRISYRRLRVANLIKGALIEVLAVGKGLDFVLLRSKVIVTNVKMSPDLKVANCYVIPSVINEGSVMDILRALNKSKRVIRFMITSKVHLKFSPEIRFFHDVGFNNVMEVSEILSDIQSHDGDHNEDICDVEL